MLGVMDGDEMATYALKCPGCEKKFKYDVTDGWPDFCPMCGHKMGNDRPDDEIVMPAFLSQKSRNNDAVARQIMDGSEQRAEMAAAMAGVPVSEMSGLKITNLNDRNDAQVSAMPVNNPVTQHMAAMGYNGWQGGIGPQMAANAHTDRYDAYAGRREHSRIQRAIPPIAQPPMPLEIVGNPNYRRRA